MLSSIYVLQNARQTAYLDNDSFALAGSSPVVTIWNIKTKAQMQQLIGHSSDCWALVKIKEELLSFKFKYRISTDMIFR